MAETLTPDVIEAAERVFGVTYTAAERALMLDTLEEQLGVTATRRALRFDNAEPPALRFDPRLPETRMPAPGPLRFRAADPGPLPADPEDIAFAPLWQLSAWIAARRITSAELTGIYLDRIERLNPHLFCFATVTADLARAQAAAADAALADGTWLGPLHGIPYALKDLFDTAGIPTGWGAEPYRDRVPDRDAAVVARLRAAGAVLLGKTAVGALAYGDIWYGGTCRNPWNREEGSSGSSAGSASATAAGLCGFAIGTETLGSITSPSQRCGTTGLRPTFGRISRRGGMALCPSLDKVGPICRAVEDTAMVLSVLNGPDPQDRGSIDAPFAFDASAGIEGLRIGYLPAAFGEEATDVDHAALEAVRHLGLSVTEVSLPDQPWNALLATVYAEAAAMFETLTLEDTDDLLTAQTAGAWPNLFRAARFLSAVDHVQLDRLRFRAMRALHEMFEKIDVLIGPFSTGPMLVASNFTGHPCLHLRAGFLQSGTRARTTIGRRQMVEQPGPKHRVPQGISLWGRLFEEDTILRLGMALETELAVAAERPPLPAG